MKQALWFTTLFAATALSACKAEEPGRHPVRPNHQLPADVLARLPLAQQEALLGPPAPGSKRVRALVGPSDLTLGPADAPVVLVAFVDFDAPDGDAVNALVAMHEKHPTDVRIAVKPLASGSAASREAAAAVLAAAAQGKGFEVARCASRPEREAALGVGTCTAAITLDMDRYAHDLLRADAVLADNAAAANRLAIERAPTLFLNGYRIRGVPPTDVLEGGVTAAITHAGQVARLGHLERGQVYAELMSKAAIPNQAAPAAELTR